MCMGNMSVSQCAWPEVAGISGESVVDGDKRINNGRQVCRWCPNPNAIMLLEYGRVRGDSAEMEKVR